MKYLPVSDRSCHHLGGAVDENTLQKNKFLKSGLFNNGFYCQDIVMAFSLPEYCRLFAQKKAYQGGVTGTPGPPLATPLRNVI